MTFIDAHQHFWAPVRGDYGWMEAPGLEALRRDIGPGELRPLLAVFGIGRTVLVQAAPSLAETHYLLGIADATDFVARVVGWIDFHQRDELRALTALAAHGKFAGIRPMIQDIADPGWMLRPDIAWGFDAIRDLGLTFDALGHPRHIENFLRLLDRYPDMPVVLDHCLKPGIAAGEFDSWAAGISRLAAETGALCKLSGLATEAGPGWTVETLRPWAGHVLASFGPDRVIWGSDWPVLNLNGTYGDWWVAARELVPAADQAAVFGGNAARFYRIG